MTTNWIEEILKGNYKEDKILEGSKLLLEETSLLIEYGLLKQEYISYFKSCYDYLLSSIETQEIVQINSSLKLIFELVSGWNNIFFLNGKNNIREYVENILYKKRCIFYDICEYSNIPNTDLYSKKVLNCCEETNIENVEVIDIYFYIDYVFLKNIEYWTRKKRYLEKIHNSEVCITGLSYFRDAISSDICDKNIINLSNSSQDLYYDLQLLKKVLDITKSIKTVLIGLAPYSLRFDLSMCKSRELVIRNYSYFHDLGECHNLDENNIDIKKLKKIKDSVNKIFGYDLLSSIFYSLYGLEETKRGIDDKIIFDEKNINEEVKKEIEGKYNKPYENTKIEYCKLLEEYFELCNKKNIKIIVMIPPFSNWYKKNWDKKYKDELTNIILQNKEKYNLIFCDYSEENWDNYYFRDYGHLNKIGAYRLTQKINDVL